jgi:Na+/H+ antiporter NhaD/arsenite permease-like protein
MIAALHAGHDGAFAPMLSFVSTPDGKPVDAAYFWLSGILSSFLDNAPTYLAFFNLAGGDAQELMGPLASTLLAISAGAVFMGANTYIGNAPNFMVRCICEERGIRMPSFINYMLWSGAILLPLFALFTWLWFL